MQIWRWDGFFDSLLNPYLLEGAIISICLTIGSLVIGLLIGIGIALMRLSGKRALSSIAAF
jgi:polar amino acid transport system permease protein